MKRRSRGGVALGLLTVLGVAILAAVSVLMLSPVLLNDITPLVKGVEGGVGQALAPPSNSTFGAPPLLYQNAPRPPDYLLLVNYTLGLINQDRSSNGGLNPVVLAYNPAAQQHAYSMLLNGYLSHWDTQGYKPYMRYTITGGNGFVEENVGYVYLPGAYKTTAAVEDAIKRIEYEMVYNDAAHDWGHRLNILDPSHTGVAIGVSYDSDYVYVVQDFSNDYIRWSQPITVSGGGNIVMSGDLDPASGMAADGIQMVQVFFDPWPARLTVLQLKSSPYDGPYSQGTFVAGVLPPGYGVQGGTTITADQWLLSSTHFAVSFSLAPVIKAEGPGCYTLYIAWKGSEGHQVLLTSYTVFVNPKA